MGIFDSKEQKAKDAALKEIERAAEEKKNHKKLYNYIDNHGGGELIKWMRYANASGDHSIVDSMIETKIADFLNGGGKGKVESISTLVKIRNTDRNATLSALRRKKGRGKDGPNILEDLNQEGANQGDLKKALKLLDGGNAKKGETKYREVVWKLDERGTQGEGLLGACLLQGSPVHVQIAMKLIVYYPIMVNEIFVSELYYGLTPLHQAIVNEDPRLASYLLSKGADIHSRCYGEFFTPNDQKTSRTDSVEHEWVDLPRKTNYEGRMYFGEYPLSFAACTNQTYCYKLLRSKKADPNLKDTNGNTVLHMTVIHENMEMFKLACESGAKINILNNQNLTPLTLAAKLAKKTIFEELLKLERDVVWVYGDANSYAYPLAKIDTVDQISGNINNDSALSLVIYGDTSNHLDLLDGLLVNLLEAKWKAFAKRKLVISFFSFLFYYAIFFMAFMNRPFSMTTSIITDGKIMGDGQINPHYNKTGLEIALNAVDYVMTQYVTSMPMLNGNFSFPNREEAGGYFKHIDCHLWDYSNPSYWYGYVRMVCEPLIVIMVLFQMFLEFQDLRHLGRKRWWRILKSFPAKISYKLSWILVILMVPVRFACGLSENLLVADNVIAILCVILTTMHFLFFCQSFKFISTFVSMIYTIIANDLRKFLIIYIIFLFGFSQAFSLIFLNCEREKNIQKAFWIEQGRIGEEPNDEFTNIVSTPPESIFRLFIMSAGEFMVFYRMLSICPVPAMEIIGKLVFLIYELFVSIMQLNLLIAMLTRTYETIFNTTNEYVRQWAQVILMLECSLTPEERKMAMLKYSRPIGTDKSQRAFVVSTKSDNLTDESREEKHKLNEEMQEERRKLLKKRLKDITNAFLQPSGSANEIRPLSSYKLSPSRMKRSKTPSTNTLSVPSQ